MFMCVVDCQQTCRVLHGESYERNVFEISCVHSCKCNDFVNEFRTVECRGVLLCIAIDCSLLMCGAI